jgi:hypothetical protein
MSLETMSDLVAAHYERIDAAMRHAEQAAHNGPAEAHAAYDEVVAELTRHLFAMEAAVLPIAAHALHGQDAQLRSQIDRLRELEAVQLELDHVRDTGAADALWGQLVKLLAQHRAAETRILTELDAGMDEKTRAVVVDRLNRAWLASPTRPHPHAVRRLSVTRALYRIFGLWDRILDVLDSRVIPELPAQPRRPADSKWDGYVLGRPPSL